MDRPQVALVCPDDGLRLIAAAAFDDAPSEWDIALHRQPPNEADVVVGVGVDAGGDVVLDPADPGRVVEAVRSMLDARASRTIAVCGSSGGCGATTVALHLAAEGDEHTCVVDLGRGRSCASRLGIDPAELDDAPGPIPVPGGFRLWRGGAADPWEGAALHGFERVIVDVADQDLGRVVRHCDSVVIVMSPTLVSAKQAAPLVEVAGDTPTALVANRLGPGGETTRAELQRIVGRRISLELPCSRGVRDAEGDTRLLSSSWSPWLRRVARLSAALAR